MPYMDLTNVPAEAIVDDLRKLRRFSFMAFRFIFLPKSTKNEQKKGSFNKLPQSHENN